jgi:chondroitin AC lyase
MRACIVSLLLASAGLVAGAGEAAGTADDVAVVRHRILESFCWPPSWASRASLVAAAGQAREYASRLYPNGTWPDVVYDDPQDRTIWQTAEHTARVQLMSGALSYPGSPAFNDGALFNSTRLALNAWLVGNYTNLNWWWTILQTPQTIAASFLMLDVLPSAPGAREPFPNEYERAASLAVIFRAAWWDAALGYIVTGANLAWMVQAQLLRAVWPSLLNSSAIDGGFERLWQEVKVVPWLPDCTINGWCNGTNQGIQADGSWHFHGPQLQTAQYGQDYMSDELAFIAIADGTQWALDDVRAQTLCFYAAGMAWHSSGQGMDWVSSGRALDRSSWGAVSKVSVNATLLRMLATRCNTSEASSLVAAFADSLNASAPTAAVVQGNRAFWTSDYLVHKRPGWSASWKGLSNRTMPNECGNGENLLGIYEAQGVLNLVEEGIDGDGSPLCVVGPDADSQEGKSGPIGWGCGLEYALLFPLLDWTNINGATALSDLPMPPCGPAPQCCWESALVASRRAFVGSASDGEFGVAAMDAAYLTLTARKATLFFDRAVVSLGAGVSESSGASAVRTGLASRFLRGDARRTGLSLGLADGSRAWAAANSSATALNASFPGGAGRLGGGLAQLSASHAQHSLARPLCDHG